MEYVVSNPLADREIVIAVGGGIAAYKVAAMTSGLVQRSANISIVMTRNSRKFIGAATFAALTGRPVASRSFDPGNFPLGAYGLAFYLPITTGDGPTFGLIGVKPINDRFSLEGFYLRQSLEGPDFYSGEIQANAKLKDGIEAFVTGVLTSEGNSARAGIRLK